MFSPLLTLLSNQGSGGIYSPGNRVSSEIWLLGLAFQEALQAGRATTVFTNFAIIPRDTQALGES
jgi:hypothetical protein